jgi:uroporphyrinogen-III synthase
VAARPSAAALAAAAGADAVAFTSSSTVTSWLEAAGAGALPPVVACIGPVTAATCAEHGVPVTVVAAEHTIDGLVDALAGALGALR